MALKSRLTAVLAMTAVAGIGLATPSLATSTASSASAPSCGIYWGSEPKPGNSAFSSAVVKDVRTGQHACYDRVVIDVHGGPVGRWTASYDQADPTCFYARGGANLIIGISNAVVPAPDGYTARRSMTSTRQPMSPDTGRFARCGRWTSVPTAVLFMPSVCVRIFHSGPSCSTAPVLIPA